MEESRRAPTPSPWRPAASSPRATPYLVRGTSSLWSNDTEEALLSTEGANVRKESEREVEAQVKSEAAAARGASPLAGLLWQARQEQGPPAEAPSPCAGPG